MLQFVSNQVGEFPDLFSEQLCSSFTGGSGSGSSGSGSNGGSNSNGRGSGGGTTDPAIQRAFNQVPLPTFSPSAASPQAPALQVKVSPTPPRATPVLQPRPQPQPQPSTPLQQQTVMITPTFSTAPQTRIIQQPLIYQNAATSFQGDSGVRQSHQLVPQPLCQCVDTVDLPSEHDRVFQCGLSGQVSEHRQNGMGMCLFPQRP